MVDKLTLVGWDGSGMVSLISTKSGGDLQKNRSLIENLSTGTTSHLILKSAQKGTPIIKIGKGSPKVMMVSGVHGNELPPQIAALKLIEELQETRLRGTVYSIPFAAPWATMENTRWFKGSDLNRVCSSDGSITNNILKLIRMLNIDSVADFHSTKLQSNPGRESVFCSKNPCKKSYDIGEHITTKTFSELICYDEAGSMYNGALEDECNLMGIPAVTCEVVSENGEVNSGSPERSLLQMQYYLEHFKIIK